MRHDVLHRSYIEDRLIFTVGGTFDVPIQSTYEQTIRLFPDVTIELLLNKSGTVRASFFYRENVDYFNPGSPGGSLQTRRYGASISYGREFDSFGNLLPGDTKKKGRGKRKPASDSTRLSTPATSSNN